MLERAARPRFTALAAALWLLLCLPAAAQEAGGEALKAEIERDFRVLVLRSALVLEPRGEGGGSAVELGESGLAIDGQPVTPAELESVLGERSAAVLRLSELAPEERRRLFSVPSPPPAPPAPPPPAAVTGEPEVEPPPPPRPPRPRHRRDAQVVVGDDLTIAADEVSRDVVVVGGKLRVDGKVTGDAVAVAGSVTVSGEVTGDVAAVGGSLRLEPGAQVFGDAVAIGGEVEQGSGAEVMGDVVEVPFAPNFRFGDWSSWDWDFDDRWKRWERSGRHLDFSPLRRVMAVGWQVFSLVIIVLLACLVLLVAPGAVERVEREVGAEPWKSALVGLLAVILALPVLVLVCFVLLISIIGIPLLLLVPFAILAFCLVAFLGFTAVALKLGRLLAARFDWRAPSAYWLLILGVVVLEIWAVFADLLRVGGGPLRFFAFMFALFGGLLGFAAWTVGLGAALRTRFGTAADWQGGPPEAGALPPPPPPPADAGGWEVPLEPGPPPSPGGDER